MALSEIITTTIQAGTVSPARKGFGVPLILAFHTVWATDEVRTYTTFSGVAADFGVNEPVYQMAQKMFSQSPRPEKIKVARLLTPATGQLTTVDLTDYDLASTITGTVESPDGTITVISVPFNTDLLTTVGDLQTALNAITDLTAVAASPEVGCTADVLGESFWFQFTIPGVDVHDQTLTWGYESRLDNVLNVDPEWYAVVTENNSPDNMAETAVWTLANDRIAFFGPQYSKPALFSSAAFTVAADHTALLANDTASGLMTKEPRNTFKECAWAANGLPTNPGSITWAFRQLAGVGADTYTATERTLIEDATRGMNHYVAEAQIGITRPGEMFGGEFIDVVRSIDWLEARLQERLFALLVNEPKVPYTDAGLSQIESEVRGQLQEAFLRGVIDSDFTVTILEVSLQATADRAARTVRGVEFQARLQGAVHKILLIGTVTV